MKADYDSFVSEKSEKRAARGARVHSESKI